MIFGLLQARLLELLRRRVRCGELTERGLARAAGLSQPHLHNVLKGIRVLSPAMADRLATHLRLRITDLLLQTDLAPLSAAAGGTRLEIPLLAGRLGPAHPFPDLNTRNGSLPFRPAGLEGICRPVAAMLAADPALANFHAEDIVVLEPFRPAALAPDTYYAIDTGGGGLIRRLEHRGASLLLRPDFQSGEETLSLSLADRHILDVVRCRVIWIGHYLETSPDWRQSV